MFIFYRYRVSRKFFVILNFELRRTIGSDLLRLLLNLLLLLLILVLLVQRVTGRVGILCRQETTARPPTGRAWAGAHHARGRRKAEVITIITRVLAYLFLILYIPVERSSAVEIVPACQPSCQKRTNAQPTEQGTTYNTNERRRPRPVDRSLPLCPLTALVRVFQNLILSSTR